jgi:hypothetical protein
MYAIQVCRLKYENGKTKRNHTGVQRVRVPPFLQNTKTIKKHMKNTTLNALNNLIAKHPQVEEAFYAATLYDDKVTVQGYLNAETINITRALGIKLSQHPEQPWFDGNVLFDEILFSFTLTA